MKTFTHIVLIALLWSFACTIHAQNITFSDAEMISGTNKGFGNSTIICGQNQVDKAELFVVLKMGQEDYEYGSNAFNAQVTLQLIGNTNGAPVNFNPIKLSIDQSKPEMWVRLDYSSSWQSILSFSATPSAYTSPTIGTQDILLEIKTSLDYRVDVASESVVLNPIDVAGNPGVFTWDPSCPNIPGYQIQILRLHNTDPDNSYLTNPKKVKTTIDWSNALSVWTDSPDSAFTAALSAGTGIYLWRVRPVGNINGGPGHSRDWGSWSMANGLTAPETGQQVDLEYSGSGSLPGYAFYYDQFDEDKNWVHSRAFNSRGNLTESVMYADKLGQPRQKQTRMNQDDQVLAAQTMTDLSGRPAFESMSAPIGQGQFTYLEKLLQDSQGELYVADDFDSDANWENPLPISDGPVQDYYSDDNEDLTIAGAGGYPYTRVLYDVDGSNRVIESSSVGATYRKKNVLGETDRTNKMFYSDVADIELIRVFSDEAPEASAVSKQISIDANKTTRVSYIDKDGKLLATCLSVTDEVSPLQALASEQNANFNVEDTIREDNNLGNGVWSKSKKLVLTKDKSITLNYSITPASIASSCANFCTTCDYTVDLIVHDLDDPDNPYTQNLVIQPSACGTGAQTSSFTVSLKARKKYVLERRIRSGIIIPGSKTSSNPLGETYLQAHLDSIEKKLEEHYDSHLNTLYTYLDASDIEGFYNHLNTEMDYDSISGQLVLDTCFELNVPRERCERDACPDGAPSFEQYLFDTWPAWAGSTPDLNDFFKTNGSGTFLPMSCTQGCFDQLISNMIADGYDCTQLWNCWVPIVLNFDVIAFTEQGGASVFNTDFDLLGTFLNCVEGENGIQFQGVSNMANGPTGYLSQAHKYFNYTQGDEPDCEQLFGLNAGNWVPVTMGWTAIQWQDFYNCVSAKQKYASLKSIKKFNSTTNKTIDTVQQQTQDYCLGMCFEKRYAFMVALVDEYKSQGYQLNADQTKLIKTDLSDSIPMSDLDCVADNLVSHCQNHCDQMLIYQIFPNDSILQSLGSVQLDEIIHAFSSAFDIKIPGSGNQCDPGYTLIESGYPVGGKTIDYDLIAELYDWVSYWQRNAPNQPGTNIKIPLIFPNDILENDYGYSNIALVNDHRVLNMNPATLYHETGSWHFKADGCKIILITFDGYAVTDSIVLIENACKWQPLKCNQDSVLQALNNRLYDLQKSSSSHFNIPLDLPTGVSLPCNYSMSLEIEYTYAANYFKMNAAGMIQYVKEDPNELEPLVTDVCRLNCACDRFTLLDSLQKFQENVMIYMQQNTIDTMTVILPGDFPLYGMPVDLLSCLQPGSTMGIQFRRDVSAENFFNIDPDGSLVFYQHWNDSNYVQKTLCSEVCDINTCNPICFKWTDFDPPNPQTLSVISCEERLADHLKDLISSQLARQTEYLLDEFKLSYEQNCTDINDLFIASYQLGLHHYSLFYYDRAGNVVRKVAPKDVVTTGISRGAHVSHLKQTEYRYNSLGQVIQQFSPDQGTTRFWYDDLGLLRFTQNAQQEIDEEYSFIKYDELGRTIEIGSSTVDIAGFYTRTNESTFPLSGEELTKTVYTDASSITYIDGSTQQNIENRVSYAYTDEDGDLTTSDQMTTVYSYDQRGNIEWIVQDMDGLGKNYMRYEYDLMSGNLLKVYYNESTEEQFIHRFTYDKDNRLIQTETSTDGMIWDRDARYEFYAHGPLKRTLLGEDQIQGLDFVYTLRNQLKGLNHSELDVNKDPGGDGKMGSPNDRVAPDAFGMILGYYAGDFNRSFSGTASEFNSVGSNAHLMGTNFYGGGISTWLSQSDSINGLQYQRQTAYSYSYDALNRMLEADYHAESATSPSNWQDVDDFGVTATYDANGNINTLDRDAYDGTSLDPNAVRAMDRFSYHYYSGTNRLEYIDDGANNGTAWDDIEDQSPSNYSYDAIGNLTEDVAEGLTLTWNSFGKIKEVERKIPGQGIDEKIFYRYDIAGRRVVKAVQDQNTNLTESTFYIYDHTGAMQAVYDQDATSNIQLKKRSITSGSQIGQEISSLNRSVSVVTPSDTAKRKLGSKYFTIGDQVNSVRAVVSDLKNSTIVGGMPQSFKADLKSKSDFYAYGMSMPGKSYNQGTYDRAFGGMIKDDETSGQGNSYHTFYRKYDPRTGRWNSVDPLNQYSSPYLALGNSPMNGTDPDGGWFWEGKHIRQARVFARHTGGDLKIYRWEGKRRASVDFEGTGSNEATVIEMPDGRIFYQVWDVGVTSVIFKKGQDRSELLYEVNVGYYTTKRASTSGLDNVKWILKSWDAWAYGWGEYNRNGQAPGAIKFIANLNPIVSGANAVTGYTSGEDIYGEEQSALSTGLNTVGALAPLLTVARVGTGVKVVAQSGDDVVYHSVKDGVTQYVGITNNFERRAAEHLAKKGISIEPLIENISRVDARAMEQSLINAHKLGKNGGTLLNKINSISTKNPIYDGAIQRGDDLLRSIGYEFP